jgi:hypothetical protein
VEVEKLLGQCGVDTLVSYKGEMPVGHTELEEPGPSEEQKTALFCTSLYQP